MRNLHPGELVRMALNSLWRYKLRSFLTMLGIIFGIAAVMTMMGVGAGAEQELLAEMEKLGLRNIIINSVRPPLDTGKEAKENQTSVLEYGLTFKDLRRIRNLSSIAQVLPVQDLERDIWIGSKQIPGRTFGVNPEYQELLRLDIVEGRFISAVDEAECRRVCLVTTSVLGEMRYLGNPLDLVFLIGGEAFQVVGVLASDEFQSASRKALEVDRKALNFYIPYATAFRRFGVTNVKRQSGSREATRIELSQILVEVSEEDKVEQTARLIHRILELHEKQDTEVVVPLDKLRQSQKTQQVFDYVMLLIAGISLLVGGIGIVNIMLATITERTREIGVRRALGARRQDIVLQFLVETTMLSSIGGALGCLLGLAGVFAIRAFVEWNAVVTIPSVVIAIGISCGVGVVFGLYPARKASRMNPIRALRHE